MGPANSDRFWSPKLHSALSCSVLSLCLLSFDLHSQTPSPFLCQIKIAVCLSFLCLFSPFSVCLLLRPSLPLHCVNSPMLTLDRCGVELGLQKKKKILHPSLSTPSVHSSLHWISNYANSSIFCVSYGFLVHLSFRCEHGAHLVRTPKLRGISLRGVCF